MSRTGGWRPPGHCTAHSETSGCPPLRWSLSAVPSPADQPQLSPLSFSVLLVPEPWEDAASCLQGGAAEVFILDLGAE